MDAKLPLVCVEQNCQNRVIIGRGDYIIHKDHKMISLTQFRYDMEIRYYKEIENVGQSHRKKQNEVRDEILALFSSIVDMFILINPSPVEASLEIIDRWAEGSNEFLEKNQNEIYKLWNVSRSNSTAQVSLQLMIEIRDSLRSLCEITSPNQESKSNEMISKYFRKMIGENLTVEPHIQLEDFSESSVLNLKAKSSFKLRIPGIQEEKQNPQIQLLQRVNEFVTHTDNESVKSEVDEGFRFSTDLKHANIQVKSPTIITINENLSRMALVTPAFTLNGGIQKIGFIGNASFGICHAEILRESNYVCKWDQANHGVYMIDQGEKSYSHGRAHSVSNSFKYTTKQPIYLYFDSQRGVLIFKNGGNRKQFSMRVNMDLGRLHPCVEIESHIQGDIQLIQSADVPDLDQ